MADIFTDALGTPHPVAPKARILSLVPSLTELVFALGLADRLVGRTHYCIHPDDRVARVPSVGGTKKIKMSRVRDLAPTHALMNVDENPRAMADELQALGIRPVVTHPMHPDENPALYDLIGGLFGRAEAAARLSADYAAARTRLIETTSPPPGRVLYLIWKDPWMAVGGDTYIGNTLALVNWVLQTPGADPALSGDAARYPEIVLSEASLASVDLVLFSSEPYTFTARDIDAFRDAFPAHAAKAHLIDGEMTSWYGPRAIAGLDYLGGLAARLSAEPRT